MPDESLSPNSIPGPSTIQNGENKEHPLEENILQLLGDAPQSDVVLGKEIHKEIAGRWQEILKNGLSKEIKDKLTGQYLIPANCNLLLAPILNPEAKAAVPDIIAKRDTTMFQKQNQIGIALAALSTVMELVISNETSKQKLLQPLSDDCRILCDSHNAETKTRRGIFLNAINTGLRETLASTNRDKYLFGEDVSEKLKIAKNVQKTGESLQKVTPKPNTKNAPQYKNKNYLNSKGNLRKQSRELSKTATPARGSHHPPPATCSRSPNRRHFTSTINHQVTTQPPPDTNIGCREIMRQALLKRCLSPRSVDIMLASLSSQTYKQYDVCVKAWLNYCKIHYSKPPYI
ncbi:uncharacterized protein LOC128678925 [Plodia interpunctella]|uniref:uncharacterized protein LOC128678925 n=1 Tax=Plodia interpunctella TaxID=58824 RepID=UPI0031017F42